MLFEITPSVFNRIPGLRVLVVVFKVAAGSGTAEEEAMGKKCLELLTETWNAVPSVFAAYETPQSHANLQEWRECYKALGIPVKKYTCSIESLIKRAVKSGGAGGSPRSINPLVNFYNAISIRNVVPFGGFDLDACGGAGKMSLRETRQGDFFQALDEEAPSALPPGELAYVLGDETVVTRHINYKQSKLGLITATSKNVVLMTELLAKVPEAAVQHIMEELKEKIKEIFNADCQPVIVDSKNNTLDLGAGGL